MTETSFLHSLYNLQTAHQIAHCNNAPFAGLCLLFVDMLYYIVDDDLFDQTILWREIVDRMFENTAFDMVYGAQLFGSKFLRSFLTHTMMLNSLNIILFSVKNNVQNYIS